MVECNIFGNYYFSFVFRLTYMLVYFAYSLYAEYNERQPSECALKTARGRMLMCVRKS